MDHPTTPQTIDDEMPKSRTSLPLEIRNRRKALFEGGRRPTEKEYMDFYKEIVATPGLENYTSKTHCEWPRRNGFTFAGPSKPHRNSHRRKRHAPHTLPSAHAQPPPPVANSLCAALTHPGVIAAIRRTPNPTMRDIERLAAATGVPGAVVYAAWQAVWCGQSSSFGMPQIVALSSSEYADPIPAWGPQMDTPGAMRMRGHFRLPAHY